MDDRIRQQLERDAGLPIDTFPDSGIRVRVSEARTDESGNRLSAVRIAGKEGVLVTWL